MRFYRSINKIKALTFDLDDTLYDNRPYLVQAETALINTIKQIDGLQDVQLNEYNQIKRDILLDDPEIYHDVFVWRVTATRRFLKLKGVTDKHRIDKIADDAINNFVIWRNKITVPQQSLNVLATLANRYPMVVITNGNVDINQIGLGQYFQCSLRGGPDGRSKPFPEIFQLAAKKLTLPTADIMHIGDHLYADVQGAINSGMQSCWLNMFNDNIYHHPDARILPHVEITELPELNHLL